MPRGLVSAEYASKSVINQLTFPNVFIQAQSWILLGAERSSRVVQNICQNPVEETQTVDHSEIECPLLCCVQMEKKGGRSKTQFYVCLAMWRSLSLYKQVLSTVRIGTYPSKQSDTHYLFRTLPARYNKFILRYWEEVHMRPHK